MATTPASSVGGAAGGAKSGGGVARGEALDRVFGDGEVDGLVSDLLDALGGDEERVASTQQGAQRAADADDDAVEAAGVGVEADLVDDPDVLTGGVEHNGVLG